MTTITLPKRGQGDFSYGAMSVLANAQGVFSWGNNTTGALANGSTGSTSVPLQPMLFNPNTTPPPSDAIIVDWAFTMANVYLVFSNGWVFAGGDNTYGQLGQGDTTARPYLTRIEYFVTNNISVQQVWAAGAAAATNGGGCVYFQTMSGSTPGLYGCGANVIGNLGNASTPTTNLTTPGLCAGIGTGATVTDVAVSSITSTNFSAYALLSNGSVLVAGYNGQGQLGTGTTTNVTGAFVNALAASGGNLSDIVSISTTGGGDAGGSALALDSSGNVWTTGYNGYGQLGIGSTTSQSKFTQISSLSSITQAGIGGGNVGYAYAINSSGTLYTWGYNGQNNLFKNNSTTPVTSPSTTVLAAGQVASIIFPKEEGLSSNSQMIVLLSGGTQLIYAGVNNGQLGIASTASPGAYKLIPLPLLASGETIDAVFVHGTSTSQRLFVHTTSENVFTCGANVDSVCTAGYCSNNMPASVDGFNIAAIVPAIPLL